MRTVWAGLTEPEALFVGRTSNEVDAMHTEQTIEEQLAQLRMQIKLVYRKQMDGFPEAKQISWDEWAEQALAPSTRKSFGIAERLPICKIMWPRIIHQFDGEGY